MKHAVIGFDPAAEGNDHTAVAFVRDGVVVSREEVATCAVCGHSVCDHSDIDFAGFERAAQFAGLS
jgi:hypothetical protein